MGVFVTTAKPNLMDTDTRVQRVTRVVHGIVEIIEENRISFPNQKTIIYNYMKNTHIEISLNKDIELKGGFQTNAKTKTKTQQ